MKLLFNFFLISCCLMTVLSCDVHLEDNTRILAKGIVKDQDNMPVTDAKVSVQTRRSNYSGGENYYVLGEGNSTSDGSFSVISFYDKDEDFAIQIDGGENYSMYVYKTNTLNYTPLDLTFNLETVNLKKLANFNINVTKTSVEANSISFNITYIEGFCLEYYEGTNLNEYQTVCYQERILNRTLDEENPDYDTNLRIPFGETVVFTYSINDEPEITEVITINQDNHDFSFNY